MAISVAVFVGAASSMMGALVGKAKALRVMCVCVGCVCVCVCVCVCACVHACGDVCMYVCRYACQSINGKSVRERARATEKQR